MLALSLILRVAAALCAAHASTSRANPLGQVVDLLTDLATKVKKEAVAEAQAYKEYAEWCDDVKTNKGFEIKTATAAKEALETKITKLAGDIEVADSKVADLVADISSNSAEMNNASAIRDSEVSNFVASEKELVEVIDTLGRATTAIEREMQKKNTAFTQLSSKGFDGLLRSLDTIVDAGALTGADKQRLTALVQSAQNVGEDSEELGAPAAAIYESRSHGILDTLEDLKEKAEEQLSTLRKGEVNSKHNYEMVKQSLEDQIAADNKDLSEEKAHKSAASESKAGAEGELKTTVADLKVAEDALATAEATCIQVSEDHEATVAARNEEVQVIGEAIEILRNTTLGSVEQRYSFLQTGASSGLRIRTRADLARSEVLTLIKKLAKQQHSEALAQLAFRIATVVRYSAGSGAGPFSKVKALINDLITRLQEEAGAEATEKSFCDEEMAKTDAKKTDLETALSRLTTAIDAANAKSASLKGEVKEAQDDLATLAQEEAEMNKIRQETHADYVQAKADYEQGLGGVRHALVMLREYYAAKQTDAALLQSDQLASFMRQPAPVAPEMHAKSAGAGTNIIGILEVVENDFATSLAKEETAEATAQEAFEKMNQENKITRATKSQDIKYKSEEAAGLDKEVSELTSDRENTNTEQTAVLEYLEKLEARCIAKPETYETRKQHREAEIAGLKEALSVLEQASFVQRAGAKPVQRRNRRMRGALRVGAAA